MQCNAIQRSAAQRRYNAAQRSAEQSSAAQRSAGQDNTIQIHMIIKYFKIWKQKDQNLKLPVFLLEGEVNVNVRLL